MVKLFLLNLAVVSISIIFQTWGHKLLQPFGPVLCDLLCQRTKGCFDHLFDEVHLTCQLVGNETSSKYKIKEKELKHVCIAPNRKDLTHADFGGVRTRINTQSNHTEETLTVQKEDAVDCPEVDENEKDFIDTCKMNLDEVKRLVCQELVDINCRDVWEETCVMQAALYNNSEMFDFLIQNGGDLSDVDEENRTVLHFACEGGNMYIVKKLVDDHKSDIHWRNKDGKTPLFYAKSLQVFKFLQARGANLSSVDDNDNTILHQACNDGHIGIVRYILSLGIIDLECKGEGDKTPLMKAVENNKLQLVHILHTEYGARLSSSDDSGFNVIHIASYAGDLDMVKYLVTQRELRGFAGRKDEEGKTPMFWAMEKGYHRIVSFLKSLK